LDLELLLEANLSPKKSALVVVDVQKGWFQDGTTEDLIAGGAIASGPWLSNLANAVRAFDEANLPIVFVKTVFRNDLADCYFSPQWPGGREGLQRLAEGTDGASVPDELGAISRNAFEVIKKGHSAFQFTHLDRLLRALDVETCVIAGNLPSSMEETVRQGAALGYENILVLDASYSSLPVHESRASYTVRSRAFLLSSNDVLTWLTDGTEERDEDPGTATRGCILVVDIQNEFLHPEGSQYKYTDDERQEILGNTQRLLDGARRMKVPVVYVQSQRGADRFIDTASAKMSLRLRADAYRTEGSWGAEIVDDIRPVEGDYIVSKRGHGAFGTTHLDRMLRNLGVNTIVVAGGSVVGCVADSTREAVGLGYRVILAADATYPPARREAGFAALSNRLEIVSAEEALSALQAEERVTRTT